MKSKAAPTPPPSQARQDEATKINRLRALRLAKEAADREAAAQAATLAPEPAKPRRTRVRAAPSAAKAATET